MELMTLDSSFQLNRPVDHYNSLIWTERYSKAGDFQLISNDISGVIKRLPLDSYVTLRDSLVPMKVEVYKIEKKKNEGEQITVTGRSCEACWLELRGTTITPLLNTQDVAGKYKDWSIVAAKESDAAFELMRTILGDTAKYSNGVLLLPNISPAVDPLDEIPELTLTIPMDYSLTTWNSTATYRKNEMVEYGGNLYLSKDVSSNVNQPPPNTTYWQAMGALGLASAEDGYVYNIPGPPADLYSAVMELLGINRRGLKAVRPAPGSATVALEIYNGANITDEYSFNARLNQIDDATYLLSNTGSTNVAYVYGNSGSNKVLKTAAAEPSGLARRVLSVGPDTQDTVTDDTVQGRTNRGLVELYKNNATALFGGEVAVQVAQDYNVKYFLGDILKLVGEYGLSQNVRVAEFIRSEDATGEKAYPTFEAVE